MKVFWSWQSDTPGKTGRHFIRQAILDAIAELKESQEIEEPFERENENALHLDQDRLGIPGSPDLVSTILEKIDSSRVFVADVTPVSTIPARKMADEVVPEKRNMNPNVAIELGYALRALTDRNILMVLNTYYGDRTFLPFDLAHKGGPILFDLPPDANKSKQEAEAVALRRKLVTALRLYVQEDTNAKPMANRTPSSVSPAVYFSPGETLAVLGEEDDQLQYSYPDGKGFYLRLTPFAPRPRPIPLAELMKQARGVALYAMWRNYGAQYANNKYGIIVYEPKSPSSGTIVSSTQLFPNGEIWGVAPWLIKDNELGKFIPGQAYESVFRNALSQYMNFMEMKLRIEPPYYVEGGAVVLEGARIVISNDVDDRYGPIYDNGFQVQRVLNDNSQASIDGVLLAMFEDLFRIAGYVRPKGLFGFPTES